MIIVSPDGDYELIEGTQTLKTSDHPVYQAQIELAVSRQRWIGLPNGPTPLARFDRAKQTEIKADEYRKQVAFYLQKYSPRVRQLLIKRLSVEVDLVIAEDAFNG